MNYQIDDTIFSTEICNHQNPDDNHTLLFITIIYMIYQILCDSLYNLS